MFQDSESELTQFVSNWKAHKNLNDHHTQTSEIITSDVANQSAQFKSSYSQTESILDLMQSHQLDNKDEKENVHLTSFLKTVEPIVLKQIKMNNATVDKYSKIAKVKTSNREDSLTCDLSIFEKMALNNSEDNEQLEVTGLSWSPSGSSIAVSYGFNKTMAWCKQRSYVCVWNIDRPKIKLDESDQKFEFETSVQSVLFHPKISGILAAGLFSGVVAICNLSSDHVIYTDLLHNDPVTGLCWAESDAQKYTKLLSSSSDGKMVMWKIKMTSISSEIKVESEFLISTRNIPRSYGLKGRGNLGITAFCSLNLGDRMLMSNSDVIVGLENGILIKCSLSRNDDNNPITFVYEPHKGPIYSIESAPFHRNIFLTSSIDQTCRIYHSLERAVLREVRLTDLSGHTLISASWSFTRPTLFYAAHSSGKLVAFDIARNCIVASATQEAAAGINHLQMTSKRPNLLATASSSGHLNVWRIGDGLIFSDLTLQEETRMLEDLIKDALSL